MADLLRRGSETVEKDERGSVNRARAGLHDQRLPPQPRGTSLARGRAREVGHDAQVAGLQLARTALLARRGPQGP